MNSRSKIISAIYICYQALSAFNLAHVVYKRKLDGSAKARIVPWGHRDRDKDYLRGDAPCISFEVVRIILSLAAENQWDIGQMDILAAFLQAKGINSFKGIRQ